MTPQFDPNDRHVVIYHDDCVDGAVAAWLLWRVLPSGTVLVPATYGRPAPPESVTRNAHVFVVDFSYGTDQLVDIAAAARSVVVVDHHASARRSLAGLPHFDSRAGLPTTQRRLVVDFDDTRSGCAMVSDMLQIPERYPIVRFANDCDLYRHDLLGARAVGAALAARILGHDDPERTMRAVCSANSVMNSIRGDEAMMAEGYAVLDYQRVLAREIVGSPPSDHECRIGEYVVPVRNAPHCLTAIVADALHDVFTHAPFVATYVDLSDTARRFSLRRRHGSVDLSIIAEAFGGGGHEAAAGFTVTKSSCSPS